MRTLAGVPPTSAERLRATARELAPLTRVWTALLDRHVPDAAGLCVACTRSTGVRPQWPCRLADVADMARRAAQDGRPDGDRRDGDGPAPAGATTSLRQRSPHR